MNIHLWIKPIHLNRKTIFYVSSPLPSTSFYDHLRSVFLNLTNLLIFDNIVRYDMKLMHQIRFPLSISSLLPLLSISFRPMKIDGTQHWKNWIDGTWQRQDLNPRPPDQINLGSNTGHYHMTTVPCKVDIFYFFIFWNRVSHTNCSQDALEHQLVVSQELSLSPLSLSYTHTHTFAFLNTQPHSHTLFPSIE